MFTIVDRGTGNRYVIPAKSADESTVRLLLEVCEKEPLTVYTGEFRAYDPLEEDDAFDREYVVHGDGEYADEDVHVNTCESHGSRCCDRGSRLIEVSLKISSHSIPVPSSFDENYYGNLGKKRSNTPS